LAQYFDGLTKRFLQRGSPESVDVEVLSTDRGDQVALEGARLIGITYDARAQVLELALEAGDHRIPKPKEVWVIEEPNGFVSAIEAVRQDGTKEVVSVKPIGRERVPSPKSTPSR
jgi:hypothetical protein